MQALVGFAKAAGADATMASYFVFLVDVPAETTYKGLIDSGARSIVHCSIQEGKSAWA
jgi:hypothetical protein